MNALVLAISKINTTDTESTHSRRRLGDQIVKNESPSLYDHNTQITQPAKKRLDFVATQLGSILRHHPSECTSTEIDLLEAFIGVSQLLLSQLQLSSNEMRLLYVAWLDSNAIGHQEANDKRVERNLCELRRELEEYKRSLRASLFF